MSVGVKRTVKQAQNLDISAIKEEIASQPENPFKDIYLELADGEYLSPFMFRIFPEEVHTSTNTLKLKFGQESYILEIPLNEKVSGFLAKYEHHDFYRKIKYFSAHQAFKLLKFSSWVLLSRSSHLKAFRYGESVTRTGQKPKFLYLLRKGNVSVSA